MAASSKDRDLIKPSFKMKSKALSIKNNEYALGAKVCINEKCTSTKEDTEVFQNIVESFISHIKKNKSKLNHAPDSPERSSIMNNNLPDEAFSYFPGTTDRVLTGFVSKIHKNGKDFTISFSYGMIPDFVVDFNLVLAFTLNYAKYETARDLMNKNIQIPTIVQKNSTDSTPSSISSQRACTEPRNITENSDLDKFFTHLPEKEKDVRAFDEISLSSEICKFGDIDDNIFTNDDTFFENTTEMKEKDKPRERRRAKDVFGINWELDGDIPASPNQYSGNETYILQEYKEKFNEPIESFLAFLPLAFWNYFWIETSNFASQEFLKSQLGERFPRNLFKGYSWNGNITLNELMTFFGISIWMVLRPLVGYRIKEYWNRPNEFPFVKYMTYGRYIQIRSVLHLSRNSDKNREKDSFFKVRPMLNVLKLTLPKYIMPGKNLALDECSPANKSRRGRHFIFFNKTKPGGKYHFRFYVLCCSKTYAMLSFIMCSKRADDSAFPKLFEEDEKEYSDIFDEIFGRKLRPLEYTQFRPSGIEPNSSSERSEQNNSKINEQDLTSERLSTYEDDEIIPIKNVKDFEDEDTSRISKIVLALTERYHNSFRIINCDNYYGSVSSVIDAKYHCILMRCTTQTNRKHFPKYVLFKKSSCTSEFGRGAYKFAVAKHPYHLVAMGWVDGNPVKLLTSADGTNLTSVYRQIGREKLKVLAPVAILEYNKNMDGVDRFDQLMSQYSLNKRHSFDKYYKSIIMILIDFALTQAWIHYKLNKTERKIDVSDNDRVKFIESIADSLCTIDWNQANFKRSQAKNHFQNDPSETSNNNFTNKDIMTDPFIDPSVRQYNTSHQNNCIQCNPVSLSDALPQNPTFDGKSCQICSYEGRRYLCKDAVFCSHHKIRLCTKIQNDIRSGSLYQSKSERILCEDWSWICPNQNLSCWEKFHSYYKNTNLFIVDYSSNSVRINRSSALFKRKQKALGKCQNSSGQRKRKAKNKTQNNQDKAEVLMGDEQQKRMLGSVGFCIDDRVRKII